MLNCSFLCSHNDAILELLTFQNVWYRIILLAQFYSEMLLNYLICQKKIGLCFSDLVNVGSYGYKVFDPIKPQATLKISKEVSVVLCNANFKCCAG